MSDDPIERVITAWAEVGERWKEYLSVWEGAARANAKDDYAADDFLVDLQAVWGMGVADAARVGAAVVDAMAAFLPDQPEGSSETDPASRPER